MTKDQFIQAHNQDKLLCLRCHYEWTPKPGEAPKSCPRCKSYKWNEERKRKEVKSV